MTDQERKAMEMALEWMEAIVNSNWRNWEELASPEEFERWVKSRANHSAVALRQAIAEAEKEATLQEITDIGQWDTSDMAHRSGGLSVEQEPVARFNWNEAKFEWLTEYSYEKHHMKPLYLAPPKRDWQGLTDEEVWVAYEKGMYEDMWFARAVEAMLREKNQ